MAKIASPPPILICSTTGKCLPVLLASIAEYVPENIEIYHSAPSDFKADYPKKLGKNQVIQHKNTAKNFGEAYNALVKLAFGYGHGHEHAVIANDDVVLRPDTWDMLMEDAASLENEANAGWIAARGDFARLGQQGHCCKAKSTRLTISPFFAYIRKEAWTDFPPINYYSDDVQCFDIGLKGFVNYVSRAYVHHVGGQTCDTSISGVNADRNWVKENRPDMAGRIL